MSTKLLYFFFPLRGWSWQVQTHRKTTVIPDWWWKGQLANVDDKKWSRSTPVYHNKLFVKNHVSRRSNYIRNSEKKRNKITLKKKENICFLFRQAVNSLLASSGMKYQMTKKLVLIWPYFPNSLVLTYLAVPWAQPPSRLTKQTSYEDALVVISLRSR